MGDSAGENAGITANPVVDAGAHAATQLSHGSRCWRKDEGVWAKQDRKEHA